MSLWLLILLLLVVNAAFAAGLTQVVATRVAVRWVALGAAAVATVLTIYVGLRWAGLAGAGTPGPPSAITDPTDPEQRTAVLAYARSLTFDSTHGAFDRQFLDTLGLDPETNQQVAMSGGPLGTIFAEVNAHRNREGALASGGRITAMVDIDPNSSGYAKLNLPPGRSYIWVDSLRRVSPDSAVARAVIIPNASTVNVRTARITVEFHPDFRFNRAFARWRFFPDDARGWWPCVRYGCCTVLR